MIYSVSILILGSVFAVSASIAAEANSSPDNSSPNLEADHKAQIDEPVSQALPEPLTLEFALSLFNQSANPRIRLKGADLATARANRMLIDSEQGLKVDVYGSLVGVKPSDLLSDNFKDKNTDHEAGVRFSKQIYDFGRQEAKTSAADLRLDAAGMSLQEQAGESYLTILQNFFNVILADLRFNRDNEALAMAFIRWDRARVKNELNKVSDLEVLRLHNIFQRVSKDRFRSETLQRLERAKLANSLNRPGMLPGDLELPDLATIPSLSMKRELPELNVIETRILQGNQELKQLTTQLEAEKFQFQAYKANRYPVVTAELEGTWYSRELGGSDKARAGVTVRVPIYQGGEYQANLELSKSKIMSLQASIDILKMQLKQQALEIWLELSSLKQQHRQVESALDYREMYLDKSRTDYESELKSDLGDAMVHLSEAQLLDMETRLSIAYQWAKLDVLAGERQLYGMEIKQNEK